MKWYKIPLTRDQVDKGQGRRLKHEFEEIYNEEGRPEEMALFSGKDEEGAQCYYLSPGAVKYALILLSYYSGSRCAAPHFEAVELEWGPSDAKERLLAK